MPSALETLVKILKLEREQGCKDAAVIGGLAAFSSQWQSNAHSQARRPEHHLLVDELTDLLREYDTIDSKTERVRSIGYMLDRIVGRIPPPPERLALLDQYGEAPPPPAAPEPSPGAAPSTTLPKSREKKRAKRDKRHEQRKVAGTATREDTDDGDEREFALAGEDSAPAQEAVDSGKSVFETEDDLFASSGPAIPSEPDIPPPPRLARVPRKPRKPLDPEAAADILNGLKQPVTKVKGIGPNLAEKLSNLNIETIGDLLFHLPRRYDDYTRLLPITRLPIGDTVTVIGTVRHAEVRAGRTGRKDFFMVLDDGTAHMGVTFFGQYYLGRQIRTGHQVVLNGVTSMYGSRVQMVNPEWEHLDGDNLRAVGIVPIYPLTQGIRSRTLRRIMKNLVDFWADRLPDYVPEATLERTELADLGWMLKNLHFPEGWDHLDHARRRYIFDELLTLQLAVLSNRREWQSIPAPALAVSDEFLERFVETVFPYPLTGAQRKAVADIRQDASTDVPMNRLLQGDVGSGKTAVATVALAIALENHKQAALMAPTSILAEQHYRGISATLELWPFERRPVIALLTSALSTGERESIYRGISDGSIDVVIGTHALIQEGVEFNDLAVAIIDEQHRFGVEQRGRLRGKGTNPHLLVMTATPIPRTLALTVHADLDLSVIDEMPPGRKPVETKVINPVERERVYSFVESQLHQGRQVFVVHPLVEESEHVEAPAALEAFERLKDVFFRHKVGLLHGRMKPAEKDAVMNAFSNHEFDVMVTTSVAEVGVNIPNASVMVIEGANRFGLAQLHQFRGRVGRGEHASYCLLISDTNSDEARQRLQAMESTTDGFVLAEMDWKLRGAGDLVGTRQSGGGKLQLLEGMRPELVEMAQREARTIYAEDPELDLEQHQLLAQRVHQLHDERSDVS
jgi:ATP-dependent DNA helicase RecG